MSQTVSEALDDAGAALRSAARWDLTPDAWSRVAVVIERLAGALATHEVAAIDEAVAELELAGPVRVATRIGDSQSVPPPIRERINELVEQIDHNVPAAGPNPAGTASGNDGGTAESRAD